MAGRIREVVSVGIPQTIARMIATDPIIISESNRRGIRARTIGDTRRSIAQEFIRFQQNEFMRGSELTQNMTEILSQDGHVIGALMLGLLHAVVKATEGE